MSGDISPDTAREMPALGETDEIAAIARVRPARQPRSSPQGRGGGGGARRPPPLDLPADTPRITALKTEAAAEVEKLKDFSQQMVDQIFSFGELGFQEVETSKYLVDAARRRTASRSKRASPAFRPRSWRRGATASR